MAIGTAGQFYGLPFRQSWKGVKGFFGRRARRTGFGGGKRNEQLLRKSAGKGKGERGLEKEAQG